MATLTQSDLALFQQSIREGIPDVLPPARPLDPSVSHAPKRKDILTPRRRSWPCATPCVTSTRSTTPRWRPSSPPS
jgi:hypothetical protein